MARPSIVVVLVMLIAGVTVAACGSPSSSAILQCPAHPLTLAAPTAQASSDQSMLYSDADKIIKYGVAHPDTYGGFAYTGTTHPVFRVAFTRNVAAIRSSLEGSLSHPSWIQFVTGKYTVKQEMALQQKIFAEVPKADLMGIDPSFQYVQVDLTAGSTKTAASLVHQFGAGVFVTVGGSAYVPSGC